MLIQKHIYITKMFLALNPKLVQAVLCKSISPFLGTVGLFLKTTKSWGKSLAASFVLVRYWR